MSRHAMFVRMMLRAALVRKGRAIAALLAVSVAAGVATAMLNLYVDVQSKLQKEFRGYGANLVVVAKNSSSLPPDTLTLADRALAGKASQCRSRMQWRVPLRGHRLWWLARISSASAR